MTLGQQGVPKMISREGVGGPKLKFGAKFLLGSFERTLVKVNETFVIVRLRKSGIELQGSFQFGECVGVVFLLGVGLSEQQVNAGIAGVLFKKTAENFHGQTRLASANKSGAPSEEQARIVGRSLEKRTEDFSGLRKVFRDEIADSEKLTDKMIIGISRQLPLQGRNSFGIKLGAIGGKTPVAVEAGKGGIPSASLFKEFGGIREIRSLGAHDAEIVVGAGQNLRSEGAVFFRGLGFRGLLWSGRARGRGIFLHAALYHRFGGFLLVAGAGFEKTSDAVGSVAIAVGGGGGLVENVLGVIAKFRFAIALGIRERFLGFIEVAKAAQILAKQVIGATHVAWNFPGVGDEMDVLFEGFDGLGETLRFAIDFAKIEISEEFIGTEALGMQERGFGSGKIAERNGGDAEEQERVVIFGMELQLALELQAGLRIGFLAPEFEDGVTEQCVSAGISWVELNGFPKFGDGGFRKMADGISTADQNMQC